MSNCSHCGKPLNQSQYRKEKKYKSCPRCSQADGNQHIYYEYPQEFGITSLRSSPNSPEGAQSHCQVCRGGNSAIHAGNIKCSDLD